jgi:hypothetical protein
VVSDPPSPDPEIKGKVKVQGTGCLDFVLVNLSSFLQTSSARNGSGMSLPAVHIIVELYPESADEVNFTDICCPIFDTGHYQVFRI